MGKISVDLRGSSVKNCRFLTMVTHYHHLPTTLPLCYHGLDGHILTTDMADNPVPTPAFTQSTIAVALVTLNLYKQQKKRRLEAAMVSKRRGEQPSNIAVARTTYR